jgi:hypothetical protein
MNTTPRTYNGGASDHTGNERTSSESQAAKVLIAARPRRAAKM